MMHGAIRALVLVLIAVSASAYAEAQKYYDYSPYNGNFDFYSQQYFRSGPIGASLVQQQQQLANENNAAGRLFFNGRLPTLTLLTTTWTSTSVVTTTCTTSTSALTTCSPAGRRRRNLAASGRGLFYADDQVDETGDFDVFLPSSKPAVKDVAIEEALPHQASALNLVPFVVEPGFSVPAELRGARQLINIATRTVTTTITSTYTNRLTAVCASTTGFGTCSN